MIRAVSHVSAMSPYALAELNAPDGLRMISLSQNESLRAPSPCVAQAVAEALETGNLYPDPEWRALRAALSKVHGLPAAALLCGSGSMELIGALVQAFADERNALLAPSHIYPFFRTAAQIARARFDRAPEENGQASVDALLHAVRADTRVVAIANPGNPTGTRLSRSEIVRLRKSLPSDVLLVIDEAYGEFADHLGEPVFDLVARGDTVVLRTMSKAYGLAGLRVGWGMFPPEVAVEMRKMLNPNNIAATGQAAATAALLDQAYMRETCDMTAALRDRFRNRLLEAGFDVLESYTNFVLIRFESADIARSADQALRREGVFLRPQGGAGLADSLRVTIGAQEDLDTAADLLERWLRECTS